MYLFVAMKFNYSVNLKSEAEILRFIIENIEKWGCRYY